MILIVTNGCLSMQSTQKAHNVTRVAHRGGAGLAPENTLAAFTAGLEHAPHAVELDVHLSRDGHLIVMHDPLVVRTTNASGAIADLSLDELKTLNAAARYFGPGSWGPQEIPTLDEVLGLIQGRAGVQVEIKQRADGSRYPGMEEAVIDALKRHSMLKEAVIISFDFPTLQTIRTLEPGLVTCALIGTRYLSKVGMGGPAVVAAEMAALGVDYVGVDERRITDQLYTALRASGLKIGVWTVNDESRMKALAEMGVDFITSDRPDVLRRIVY